MLAVQCSCNDVPLQVVVWWSGKVFWAGAEAAY